MWAPSRKSAGTDLLVALGLGLLLAVTTALLFQRRYFGDGPWLIDVLAHGGQVDAYALYLPAAKGLAALPRALGLELNPERTLQGLNLLGAFGVGAGLYLAARGGGDKPLPGACSAALTAFTPSVLFFLTVIEPHALHAGVVALAFACAECFGPPRVALRALALSLSLLAVAGTHLSGPALAPGLVAWAIARGRERGVRLSPRVVAVSCLPWAAAGVGVAAYATDGFGHPLEFGRFLPHVRWFLLRCEHWSGWGNLPSFLESALVLPAALAFAGGAAGLCRLAVSDRRLFLAGSLVLLSYGWMVSAWGYPEEGCYFMPVVPLLALLTGRFVVSAVRHLPGGPSARVALATLPFLATAIWRISPSPLAAAVALLAILFVGLRTGVRERRGAEANRPSEGLGCTLLAVVVALQAVFGVSGLVERNRVDLEGEWTADAGAILPRGSLVLTTGWHEVFLLKQKAGFDSLELGFGAKIDPEESVRRLETSLRAGRTVVVDERAVETYREDSGVRALLEALRRAFEWVPVERGRFRGHRLLPR